MQYKYIAASAAVALSALMTVPAAAQTVSGTVAVHGSVSARCGATAGGDASFSGTINLGELSQSNTTLNTTLANSTTNSPAGAVDFFVGCTSAAFIARLNATRLINPAFASTPPASSIIDYTAELKIALAEGGFALVDYTTSATPPATTEQTVNSFFANTPGNFQVRVFAFVPDNGLSSPLMPGSYDAVITIQISPVV